MTYRDILARKERRDPVTNRPVWPLQTQEWASRQVPTQMQEKRHG